MSTIGQPERATQNRIIRLFHDELVARQPLDRTPECLQERVGWVEKADQLGAEVHRDDQPGLDLADELRGAGGRDGRTGSDRNEEDVHGSERCSLLGTKRRLAEVAQMGNLQAVELETEDDVRPTLRTCDRIVL